MSADEQPKISVEDFDLLEKMGEGASGEVYKARPKAHAVRVLGLSDDRFVAVKLYNKGILQEPNQRKRIASEYKTGKMLVHPNLVEIYHVDVEDESRPFLVMELCEGQDLMQWREANPSPTPEEVTWVVLQLLDVLDFLHSSRRFHRDVKPTNIKIDPKGRVRLLDYGIVRTLRDESITMQGFGRFVGTVLYSAPEYLDEERPRFDCTSELYSLGAVLYHLLHGYEIYRNVAKGSLRIAKQRQDVTFDRRIETMGPLWAALLKLCEGMLHRDPALRFPSGMACWDFLAKEAPEGTVPLRAYFACALTNAAEAHRQRLDEFSEIFKRQAEPLGFSIYFPGEHTHPTGAPDLTAPEVYWIDRERVASADVLIIMADAPSFGVGQEAEIAANAGVPIVIFYSHGVRISRMLAGIAVSALETKSFGDNLELEEKVNEFFRDNRERLRSARRKIEREYHLDVGERVRELLGDGDIKTLAGELARRSNINEELLVSIVNRPEQISNVSLINLRRIARGLGVSPAKLVEEQSPKARLYEKRSRESVKSLREYARHRDISFKAYEDLKGRGLHALKQQVYSEGLRAEPDVPAFKEGDWARLHLGSTGPEQAAQEVDQMSED